MNDDILKSKTNVVLLIILVIIGFLHLDYPTTNPNLEKLRENAIFFDIFAVAILIYFTNISTKSKIYKYLINGIFFVLGFLVVVVCLLKLFK